MSRATTAADFGNEGDSEVGVEASLKAARRSTTAPTAASPGQRASNPESAFTPSAARGALLRIASVGTYSGPVGALLKPILTGLQVWVRSINATGGIDGHVVDLAVADDGLDPARHRAAVQEMVERRHVMAFVSNAEGVTGRPTVDYLRSKRIPVVGTDGIGGWVYESPMYFPEASSGPAAYRMVAFAVADQIRAQKLRRFGTIACVDAQVCTEAASIVRSNAAAAGLDLVYEGKVSIAQPDYTAACLNAQSARVEVVWVALDTSALARLADSCARQGFRPRYVAGASVAGNLLLARPNLDGAGVIAIVFPWFQSETPATREYHDAMLRYALKEGPSAGSAQGWVAGKLFETGLRRGGGEATTQALLDGLWTMRDETLGGLTVPLTFIREKNAPARSCWFNVVLRDGAYRSFDGNKRHCLPVTGDR